MRAAFRLFNALSVLMLSGAVAAAQRPTREGFWGAIGFGYGHNSLSADSGSFASSAEGGGLTLYLKAGGTPSPSIRLGGEFNAWIKDVSGVTETVGNVSAAVYFYPAPRSGFFVKGGVGLADFELSQGNASESTEGPGFVLGVGYDIRLGGKVSLTPVANFYWGHDGTLTDPSGSIPGIKHAIFDFGFGVQYN